MNEIAEWVVYAPAWQIILLVLCIIFAPQIIEVSKNIVTAITLFMVGFWDFCHGDPDPFGTALQSSLSFTPRSITQTYILFRIVVNDDPTGTDQMVLYEYHTSKAAAIEAQVKDIYSEKE